MRLYMLSCALLFGSTASMAANMDDLMELSLSQLGEIEVSIATGAPKLLTEAPAGTSVITAADLKAMGAQTIDQALESVPGLHVSRSSLNYAPRYFFRGVVSAYNPQALVLVNGIPMSRLFLGDRGERIPNQHSFPVEAIERIEVIRGPGSALYGADAFAGVIDIITRDADSVSGTELSAGVGSFETIRGSVAQPFQLADVRGAFFLTYQDTEGDDDVVIRSDRQTNVDDLQLAPPASLAPAPAELQSTYYDARLDLSWEQFRLRASWRYAWDVGNGVGTANALDLDSQYEHQDATVDLTWSETDLLPDLDLFAQVSYLHSYLESDRPVQLFPPGAVFGAFPDGMLGYPTVAEENARLDTKAIYHGLNDHAVTLGLGYFWGDLYKTTDYRNYTFVNGVPIPLPEMTDVSDTPEVFQPEAQRTSYYLYAQDEWRIDRDWALTTGVRFDDFDDVGSSVNPRLGLVWNTAPTLTTKLLYGEAFRVPAFSELYVQSNPVALGNTDLKPEKLRNTELAFSWEPSRKLSAALNLYVYRITDYIDFVADDSVSFTAQNIGRIKGHGGELEIRYQITPQLGGLVNFSSQTTRDIHTDEDLGIAPDNELYARLQWQLADWLVVPQVTVVGERQRQANDERPPLDGYTTLDLTLRYTVSDDLVVSFIGHNLADAEALEPSRGPSGGESLPSFRHDLPQQGRSLMAKLEVYF